MELIFAPEARPFSIAALMLFAVVGIELTMMLVGFQLSDLIEKSFGIDHDVDGHDGSWLSWLNVGHVPFLVLVMIVLGVFAMSGFIIQEIARAVATTLPAPIAALGAIVATIPATRSSSRLLSRIIPRDETYAVTLNDLVGRIGRVSVGPLNQGLPGNVALKDAHGNWHTVRARAGADTPEIPQGADVLLVDLSASIFTAIPTPAELGDGSSVTR